MNDYLIKFTFAFLLCAGLSGCGPRTLEDCVIEASKAPTPLGVNMGMDACYDKFRKPNGNTSQAAPPVVVTAPSLKPPASQPVKPPVQTYSPPQCVGDVASWNNCIGTHTSPDGQKYVGEWKDAQPNGQGTHTLPDGRKYIGEFRDRDYHGQGTYTWPSGQKYVGEWKDGKSNGQGTLTLPSGQKYVGEYKDGKRNGQGTLTLPDGSVGYSGMWADDKPNGQGTQTLPDGRKYVGDYRDGWMHGQGTHTWPDGVKYVGDYRDGKMHGQGTQTRSDGSVIHSGLWADDKPVK